MLRGSAILEGMGSPATTVVLQHPDEIPAVLEISSGLEEIHPRANRLFSCPTRLPRRTEFRCSEIAVPGNCPGLPVVSRSLHIWFRSSGRCRDETTGAVDRAAIHPNLERGARAAIELPTYSVHSLMPAPPAHSREVQRDVFFSATKEIVNVKPETKLAP